MMCTLKEALRQWKDADTRAERLIRELIAGGVHPDRVGLADLLVIKRKLIIADYLGIPMEIMRTDI